LRKRKSKESEEEDDELLEGAHLGGRVGRGGRYVFVKVVGCLRTECDSARLIVASDG
jgi:hypothetical protein